MTLTDQLSGTIERLGYADDGLMTRDRADSARPTPRDVAWHDLQAKTGVDAAFFRGGVPLVAFAAVENTELVWGLHKRMWNLSRIPLLIVTTSTDTAAFSCFVPPATDSPYQTKALLELVPNAGASAALTEFSRFHVEAGRVTENWPDRFQRKDRVDRQLLANLRRLRRNLHRDSSHGQAVDVLLGRTMFLRYMEDRQILTEEHLQELISVSNVIDALRSGADSAYKLFGAIGDRFNGDVFSFDQVERSVIRDEDLLAVAEFLAGTDLHTGQGSLWPYDFAVIPTEMISSIYEQLLDGTQQQDSAHYTPRAVVELIMDEAMPWDAEETESLRVLDPACGSGVFLAEAFRRMVASRSRRSNVAFHDLSSLLTDSIFGIDRNPRAIAVAAFSLYLALLEQVDPPTAWASARLPTLVGRNLVVSDFFEPNVLTDVQFDLVVGNPPWKGKLTKPAASYAASHGLNVPDNQIAWAFVLAIIPRLTNGGCMGLLLPAKSFLHNKRRGEVLARQQLFSAVQVRTVVDLSALRRSTFISATAPAVAIIATARAEDELSTVDTPVIHVAPKSSPLQAALDGYLVSQDDIHELPYEAARALADIWKIMLWGDLQDQAVINSLRASNPTLGDLVAARSWYCSRGFQLEGGSEMDAGFLLGLDLVPAEAIDAFSIDSTLVTTMTTPVIHRTRRAELYRGPLLLIRRGLVEQRRIVAAVALEDTAFNDSIIGIAAPEPDVDYLRIVGAIVNSSLAQYYHFLTGSAWGVERDTVDKGEHLTLPIPELEGVIGDQMLEALSGVETRDARTDKQTLSDLDDIVFAAYRLTPAQIDRVRDVVNLSIDHFQHQEKSIAFGAPDPASMTLYVDQVMASLSVLLRGAKVQVRATAPSPFYLSVTFTVTPPGSQRKDDEEDDDVDRELVKSMLDQQQDNWPASSTVLQPSLLVVDDRAVHVVKPRELRYWTASAARADAQELVAALADAPAIVTSVR
jgi:hypothetical protein